MAYVLGLVKPHELVTLVQRGWEPEEVPAALVPPDNEGEETEGSKPGIWVMFWVDNDLFDMMSGDDWETVETTTAEEATEIANAFLLETGQAWKTEAPKDAN